MTESARDQAGYRLGWMEKTSPHKLKMTLDRDLEPWEMASIRAAISGLGDFMNSCKLIEICDRNLQAVVEYHDSLPSTFERTDRKEANEFVENTLQEMNRLLLNYLSAVRTFLDHVKTRYIRLDRQGKPCLEEFRKIIRTCYDTSFYYRFFYYLRNHTQHRGLPITLMDIWEKPVNGSVNVVISVAFDRDVFLQDSHCKKEVKDGLLKQPQRLELLPCLEAFLPEVNNINLVVTSTELYLASGSYSTLNKVFREVREKSAGGEPFIAPPGFKDGELELRIVEFPLHQVRKYDEKLLEVKRLIAERKKAA